MHYECSNCCKEIEDEYFLVQENAIFDLNIICYMNIN